MKDNKNKRLNDSYFTLRDKLSEDMQKLFDKVRATAKSKTKHNKPFDKKDNKSFNKKDTKQQTNKKFNNRKKNIVNQPTDSNVEASK